MSAPFKNTTAPQDTSRNKRFNNSFFALLILYKGNLKVMCKSANMRLEHACGMVRDVVAVKLSEEMEC